MNSWGAIRPLQAALRASTCAAGRLRHLNHRFPSTAHDCAPAGFEGWPRTQRRIALSTTTESAARCVAMVIGNSCRLLRVHARVRSCVFDAFVQSSASCRRNATGRSGHVRILASRALGEAQAVLLCAPIRHSRHNDSEDPLQRWCSPCRRPPCARCACGGVLGCGGGSRPPRAARRFGFSYGTELPIRWSATRDELSRGAHAGGPRGSGFGRGRPARHYRPSVPEPESVAGRRERLSRALWTPEFRAHSPGAEAGAGGVAEALARAGAEHQEIEAWIRRKQEMLDAARRQNRPVFEAAR